jgi:hypothetical protein
MYANDSQMARGMAYSLIDFSRLYEFGKQYDEFALREWHAYDSAPLVDAETDTLIYPGENGILYTIKLNTKFDATTGELSMNPTTSYRCAMPHPARRIRASSDNKYWLVYEPASPQQGIRKSPRTTRVPAVHHLKTMSSLCRTQGQQRFARSGN